MMIETGHYFIVAAIVGDEVMFLRDNDVTLWSRALRQALFFVSRRAACGAKKRAKSFFSEEAVKGLRVLSLDIFGDAKNLITVGFRGEE